MENPNSNNKIQKLFSSKPLLIADGHHRYETALAFREEMSQQRGINTSLGYDYLMGNLVRMESPGLAVLAIHRLLSDLTAEQIDLAMAGMPEVFEVHEIDSLPNLMAKLETFKQKSSAVGIYTPDNKFRLLIPRSPTTEQLDVTLVQDIIIQKLFKIETLADHISYTAYSADAVDHVKEGANRVALFMNPTPVEHVLEVAMERKTMPQKSTYFYPKMATGLVLNLLNS